MQKAGIVKEECLQEGESGKTESVLRAGGQALARHRAPPALQREDRAGPTATSGWSVEPREALRAVSRLGLAISLCPLLVPDGCVGFTGHLVPSFKNCPKTA